MTCSTGFTRKVIDVSINPAFYKVIEDEKLQPLRHDTFHIYKNGYPTLTHIEHQMALANIKKMILLGQDYSSTLQQELVSNDDLEKCIQLKKDSLIGFSGLDVDRKDALEYLKKTFLNYDRKGVYINPRRLSYPIQDIKYDTIFDYLEKMNKAVMIACGLSFEKDVHHQYANPLYLEQILIRHPNLKVCIGGFGFPYFKEVAMLLLRYPNCFVETGCLWFDNAKEFYQMAFTELPLTWVERSLRHQVMFGSGQPRFEQIRMVRALETIGFAEDTLQAIFYQNACRFLGEEPCM